MPSRPRLTLPDVTLHLIQRGNKRQACFFADDVYQRFLAWLGGYAETSGCAIHAYVLMTNHAHLLITPQTSNSAGLLTKKLGQRYVQYINHTYQRSGSLWEGRFRSCRAQQEDYQPGCQRYIELNPVRAGMVEHPGNYRWSSYACNEQGAANELLSAHAQYSALGKDNAARQTNYRALFRSQLDPQIIDQIRSATNSNYALGNPRFQKQVAVALGRRVTPGKAGWPRKVADNSE